MSPVAESKSAKKPADHSQPQHATTRPASPGGTQAPLPIQALLELQAFAGNAAVAELLKRETSPSALEDAPSRGEGPPDLESPSPRSRGEGPQSASAAAGPDGSFHGGPLELIEEAAAAALPLASAIGGPMLGAVGSLLGPLVAPAAAPVGDRAPNGEKPAAADGKAEAAGQPTGAGAASSAAATAGAAGATAGGAAPASAATAGVAGATKASAASAGAAGSTAAMAGAPKAGGNTAGTGAIPAGAAGPAAGAAPHAAKTADAGVDGAAGPSSERSPDSDPNFQAVKGRVHTASQQVKSHAPASAKVSEAHAAAQGPANEVTSQAGAQQVEKMGAQQPGGFDKKAFMDALHKAIDAAAPSNLSEASDFKESGKAEQVKGQVSGLVGQNKQQAEQGIKSTTEAAPDTSATQPKAVTPLPAEDPGGPPPSVSAGSAMPSPVPAQDVDLSKGPADVNASMQDAEFTEQQLKDSNEPEFNDALAAKKTAEQHSVEAPQGFRQQEHSILGKAQGEASASGQQGLQQMHGHRAKALAAVAGGKTDAKAKDEQRRAEVSGKIESIYATTKTDVTNILNGIDPQVDQAFSTGEEAARAAFESYVDTRMTAYKDDRYSGLRGKARWIRDKFAGLPSEVNQFYAAGRELYLSRMETVISGVADLVGRELTRAKARIEQGKAEITKYVASLPADLKKVGMEAQQNIQGKFDELNQAVDSKQDDLVNDLAKKYVASRDAVDSRIKEMKEANKGLVDKAIDAVKGVVETIRKLKDMLLNVLAKAVSVIGNIIAHPIRFLGNLVDGLKQGLHNFMANIGEHLKKGLLGWLFGALGEAGLTLPEKFDLKGILSIILQVLGLTYSHIRGLAVGIVGEEVVGHLEKTVEFFQVLIKEGPAGLWKWIVDKLSEFKDTVMTKIKEFIQEKVVIAGIMWLLGLLNPVAAFIKACKAIYDIVKFFIERAEQVGELVNAILDSVAAVVGGNLGEMAGKVENALAKAIPVAIGFLASLLGLGGISEKIRSIIHAIQEPIHNVISKVLGVVLKPFKWIGNKIKAGAAWAKKKVQQGVAFVKEKAKAGVAYVKGKVAGVFGKKGPDQRTPEEKEKALASARAEAEKAISDPSKPELQIKKELQAIRNKYSMQSLDLVVDKREDEKETVHVEGKINPEFKSGETILFGDPKKAVLKTNLYFNTKMRLIQPQDQLITVGSMAEAQALMKRLGKAVETGEEGYLTRKTNLAGERIHFSATTPMGLSKGKRLKYENALPTPGSVPMPPGQEGGLVDSSGRSWERAHVGGGPGTGFEAPWILYAPNECNQVLQNNGIEQFLRELLVKQAKYKELRNLEVYQTAESFAQTGPAPNNYASMRLEEIHYEVYAQLRENGPKHLVLAASIFVGGTTSEPRVHTEGDEMIAPNFDEWLDRVYVKEEKAG